MRNGRSSDADGRFSRAAALRLSQYLRCLGTSETVSSGELARAVGVSAAQVRHDLAALGNLGQAGIGYETASLTVALRKALGIDRTWRAVLVGVGNLARALLRYRGFREQGFQVVGLFDTDKGKIGQVVEGLTVEPLAAVPARVSALRAELGVLTVPSEPAQSVADLLVAAGVKGLLNFAPVLLKTPPTVKVVTVDLSIQLEQLAFLMQPPAALPTRGPAAEK